MRNVVVSRGTLVGLAVGMVIGLAAFGARPADSHAADSVAAQVPGFDISWPQCGKLWPPGPVAFAVIGINNGRPYTANPCFLDQYRWAQRLEVNPAVYVNIEYPKPDRVEAATGPYGTCTDKDKAPDKYEWCRAYNYGYGLAKEVHLRASALRITPSTWWLDVETGNFWSNDPTYNAQVIRAAIDYFKEKKLPVGIYGTGYQWGIIAGPYAPGLPIWTAGAQGLDGAAMRCMSPTAGFAGGTVKMVQYYDFGFDTNYMCPAGHPLSMFPIADPLGRVGPSGRSVAPSGAQLPYWRALPMLSN
ncbi:MAG: hypothetical protein HYX53_08625 [Chloroflexi bacterium]|nr:hypothetical protein [Chloroflexota bacterium]